MERLELPASDAAAGIGRAFVTAFCASAGVSEPTTDDAVLITSELLTNAYLHARSAALLSVDIQAGVLRVEVADHSPAAPVLAPVDSGSGGGRGLALVAVLAHRWGVDQRPADGKTIWFELPTTTSGTHGGATGRHVTPLTPGRRSGERGKSPSLGDY